MKTSLLFASVALALTTFACASQTDDVKSADSDIIAPPVVHCGGIAGLQCADDQVCTYAPEAQCGYADATGICKKRPQFCPEVFSEVCGCDGRTYGNSCVAERAGTSVLHAGPCAPPLVVCPAVVLPVCGDDGKTYNNECEAGAAGAKVVHDGECSTVDILPVACPEIYRPVCGADGKTYGNDCFATQHTTVAHDGPCDAGSK